jgi:hypothetical protein
MSDERDYDVKRPLHDVIGTLLEAQSALATELP